MQKISFHYTLIKLSLPQASKIKAFIPLIFKKEGVAFKHIDYIFCSDEYLLDINRNFLHHDFYTDIITFPLHEKGQPAAGEIYISAERVKENAKLYGNTIQNEFLRIIVHGALHLCGYNDKTKKQKMQMTKMENQYLALF